jgi:hypothetical protein
MLVLVLLLLAANSMQQGPEALPHLHTQFRVQIRTELARGVQALLSYAATFLYRATEGTAPAWERAAHTNPIAHKPARCDLYPMSLNLQVQPSKRGVSWALPECEF